MTLRELYSTELRRLKEAGLGAVGAGASVSASPQVTASPELDALVLLCHCFGIGKHEFYMRAEEAVEAVGERCAAGAVEAFRAALGRRVRGEPVAYILGSKEFYGRNFVVREGLLVPRADTEALVDWVLEDFPPTAHTGAGQGVQEARPSLPAASSLSASAGEGLRVHDCCTGTGAIGISLQAERPVWAVSASDISPLSAGVFAENCRSLLGVNLPWFRADLLSVTHVNGTRIHQHQYTKREKYHIITANPPYLTRSETNSRMAAAWKEPRLALDGGADGLEFYRRLAKELKHSLLPGGVFYIECADWQKNEIFAIFKQEGYSELRYRRDIAGFIRVIRGQYK